ncbi:hypothetical protein CEXT_571721 [Caerostris extrusa]|uniref:Uncharacterized protein n=1 Tax=Caerostris extrusa TaxID=172846 RepID=A0AAV4PKD3_CAEEX|nr:hypothetical protein CEXT_571721 [Caerostris extrusa]
MRMDANLWKTSFKGAGDNVVAGGNAVYRRWQQVVVEIADVRQGVPVEICDELGDEVSMDTAWMMQSTGDDGQYALDEKRRSS